MHGGEHRVDAEDVGPLAPRFPPQHGRDHHVGERVHASSQRRNRDVADPLGHQPVGVQSRDADAHAVAPRSRTPVSSRTAGSASSSHRLQFLHTELQCVRRREAAWANCGEKTFRYGAWTDFAGTRARRRLQVGDDARRTRRVSCRRRCHSVPVGCQGSTSAAACHCRCQPAGHRPDGQTQQVA